MLAAPPSVSFPVAAMESLLEQNKAKALKPCDSGCGAANEYRSPRVATLRPTPIASAIRLDGDDISPRARPAPPRSVLAQLARRVLTAPTSCGEIGPKRNVAIRLTKRHAGHSNPAFSCLTQLVIRSETEATAPAAPQRSTTLSHGFV